MQEHFIRKETSLGVTDAADKISVVAKEHGFGTLNTLDLKAIMAGKGVEYAEAATVVEVCRPADAKKVLELDQRVAAFLPCRIAVSTQGGKTVAHTIKPSAMIGMLGDAELKKVACEIDEAMEKIINALP